jgi:hypothetical protein
LPAALQEIIKLSETRQRLSLVDGNRIETLLKNDPVEPRSKDRPAIELLHEILLRAKSLVGSWGGKLYFVYLPASNRYTNEQLNLGRPAVLQTADKAGIPIIDIYPVFLAQKDPLSLFPLRFPYYCHYSEKGHRLVAEEVLRSIAEDAKR